MRIFGLSVGLFVALCSLFVSPVTVFAANATCDSLQGDAVSKCNACMGAEDSTKTWTAIGCIDSNPDDLLKSILQVGIGMAGGVAFLLILFGGFQILTSAGNPEQLNAGRELVGSAVTGLLIIIFSIFILRFIGVNIIGIPGFA